MLCVQDAVDEVSSKHDHLTLLLNTAGILHIPGELSPGLLLGALASLHSTTLFFVLESNRKCSSLAEFVLACRNCLVKVRQQ